MKLLSLACLAAALAMPRPVAAESLRCEGGIAAEGDSRLSVLYKCGQPAMADAYCEPVYYGGTLNLVPEPFASALVPCRMVEEWLYERGPGNLVATLRVRAGVVQSIRYGRVPR